MPPPTPVTAAANVYGGPAYVLIGDPTQASGAGLVELGLVPRVTVGLQFNRQIKHNEIEQMLADGAYGNLQGATVNITLMNNAAAILAAMFSEVTDNTSSVSFSEAFAALDVVALIIIPVESYGSGTTNPALMCVPGAIGVNIGDFVFKVEQSNQSSESFDVEFQATRRVTDGTNAILAGYQIFFKGDMSDGTTSWSLPAGY